MNLDTLAFALEEAKRKENEARDERIKAEQALIETVGIKEDGTTTTKTNWYKVSTIGKLNRKLVATADMPDELYHAITRVKHELDVTALKKLATANPDQYREACRFIETSQAKPTVKIERLIDSAKVA